MQKFSLAVLSFVISAPVFAGEIDLGSVKLVVKPEPGFCELSESKDQEVLKRARDLAGSNAVLSYMADCKQLDKFRKNKGSLANTVQYQTMSWYLGKPFDADGIKEACLQYKTEGEKLATADVSSAQERATQFLRNTRINGQQFLGVLEEKPGESCVSAAVSKWTIDGKEDNKLSVWATASVKNRLVYLYYFSPFSGADSIPAALANLKANYSDFLAANK